MNRRALLTALALALPTAALAQHAPRAVRAVRVDEGPVMAVIRRVEARLRTTRYVHSTRVVESEGRFDWDCSGMAAWVLARAAPRAHATVMARNGRGRPVASDYHDVISAAPAGRERGGWTRLAHASELRPGDVIAWRRPPSVASRNTGHVAFVAAPARRIDREGRRWSVRVVDSTSIPHGDDTRPRAHQSGFGYGTIVVHYDDPRGEATGYGWYGLATRLDFRTHLALGRAVR
ncbi:MAG: CHAP domain-containing protein [Polyangiales bacterium]